MKKLMLGLLVLFLGPLSACSFLEKKDAPAPVNVEPVVVKYEVPETVTMSFDSEGRMKTFSVTDTRVIDAVVAANRKQRVTNGWDFANNVVDKITSPGMIIGYTAKQGFDALQGISEAALSRSPTVTNTTHTTTTKNSQSDSSVTETYGDYAGDGSGTTTFSGANSGNSGTINSDTSGRIDSPDANQTAPPVVDPSSD